MRKTASMLTITSALKSALKSIAGDRRGVAAVEYALIASLMASVLVVAVPGVAKAIGTSFGTIATHISVGK